LEIPQGGGEEIDQRNEGKKKETFYQEKRRTILGRLVKRLKGEKSETQPPLRGGVRIS